MSALAEQRKREAAEEEIARLTARLEGTRGD